MSGWLVTGAGGMLGRDLVTLLEREGEDATGYGRSDLDITDAAAVRAALRRRKPAVVVNCAAWTAVDDAETHEDAALQVNGHAVAGLAAACADTASRWSRCPPITCSTARPGSRTGRQIRRLRGPPTDAASSPGSGRCLTCWPRRSGYVVRTAWLYGAHGPNFVRTMIELERRRPAVDVVDDQHGQPSWTVDVAGQIIALVRSGAAGGVYHATSSGETTWFGLAREVFGLLGADPARVRATTSGAYPRPAPGRPTACWATTAGRRPAWSRSATGAVLLRRAFPELLKSAKADLDAH